MVIGFLGKGGSGKSTLSTLMTQHLITLGKTVLAVDADHNMDLAYNLGVTGDVPYIGGTFLPLREQFGISYDERTDVLFSEGLPEKRFQLNPEDTYTKSYSVRVSDQLRVMIAGPHTDNVLYGSHCSHSLAASLKIYLPLLDLKENEFVVVDEKASVDAVTTGIPTGFDLAVICMEPREHSIRVAQQIAKTLSWFNVPSLFALNKIRNKNQIDEVTQQLGATPESLFFIRDTDPLKLGKEIAASLEHIVEVARQRTVPNISRLERTQQKYQRNLAHAEKH